MSPSEEPLRDNKENKHDQTTLIEVDSEFWKKMRELIRAELSSFSKEKKVSWDRRPKTDEFKNSSEVHIRRLIWKYGYVTSQICKENDPWFSRKDFDYPAQWSRFFDRLVKSGDFSKFTIGHQQKAVWHLTFREDKERALKKARDDYHIRKLRPLPNREDIE